MAGQVGERRVVGVLRRSDESDGYHAAGAFAAGYHGRFRYHVGHGERSGGAGYDGYA